MGASFWLPVEWFSEGRRDRQHLLPGRGKGGRITTTFWGGKRLRITYNLWHEGVLPHIMLLSVISKPSFSLLLIFLDFPPATSLAPLRFWTLWDRNKKALTVYTSSLPVGVWSLSFLNGAVQIVLHTKGWPFMPTETGWKWVFVARYYSITTC